MLANHLAEQGSVYAQLADKDLDNNRLLDPLVEQR